MKIRYLITVLLVAALAFVSCAKPDDLVRTDSDVSSLVVKGWLVSNESVEYDAIVDMDSKTVTVQVPWYISDTEPIQGDMTQMKIRASLPLGATFEPALSGIQDLEKGIERTLVYENGERVNLAFKAAYVKSDKAQLTKVFLEEAPSALIAVREPTTADGDGTITIQKTAVIAEAMRAATLTVSPWATFESTAKNPDGTVDMTGAPDIYVTSQDGAVTRKYVTVIDVPELVPPGQVGYMSVLFGIQPTTANDLGFKPAENRTMAIVGNHLIVSSTSLNFVVLDRFSGQRLTGVQVNTTGLLNGLIHAITNDEAGHMVAISFAALNTAGVTNSTFEIYVWKNGITSAPDKVLSEDLAGSAFADFRSKNNAMATTATWNIGRNVAIKGDITGEAMLMTIANASSGSALLMRARFDGGAVQSIQGSIRGLSSWTTRSKPVPMSTADECAFIMASGNSANRQTFYTPETSGSNITFAPKGNWWNIVNMGLDYIEFNDMKLVGIQNATGTASPLAASACRLCVGNISSMQGNAFETSQIFDSRLDNYDPAKGSVGPGLQNATITGMTSVYGHVTGTYTIGTNPNVTGDVRFAKARGDEDAVQVYMLATDNGLIAYQITRYDL